MDALFLLPTWVSLRVYNRPFPTDSFPISPDLQVQLASGWMHVDALTRVERGIDGG